VKNFTLFLIAESTFETTRGNMMLHRSIALALIWAACWLTAALAQKTAVQTASRNTAPCWRTAIPAELFEAKGEDLWKKSAGRRTPRWKNATWAKARAWSRVRLSNFRATFPTPTRCKTWSLAC
jgi:hypothetical protein